MDRCLGLCWNDLHSGVLVMQIAFRSSTLSFSRGTSASARERAAVEYALEVIASVLPEGKRNLAFGLFYLGYGGGWLLGSVITGLLYEHSRVALVIFAVAMQLASLPFFVLANVVVWLTAEGSRLTQQRPERPLAPAIMDQRDHEFVPRVMAVRAGQSVKFSNSDPANHNVRTSSAESKNEFNVFTGVDGSYVHSFTADAQQRPVRVGCDIHPWMRGWIYVFEHGYFAVTDQQGRFRISSVPAGNYTLALKQPDIKYAREDGVTISSKQVARLQIEIRPEDPNKPKE